MRRVVTMIVGACALAVAGSVAAVALVQTAPGHAPFHIGCTHHNHGPKWYAGHGRAAKGRVDGGGMDVRERGITAQR